MGAGGLPPPSPDTLDCNPAWTVTVALGTSAYIPSAEKTSARGRTSLLDCPPAGETGFPFSLLSPLLPLVLPHCWPLLGLMRSLPSGMVPSYGSVGLGCGAQVPV